MDPVERLHANMPEFMRFLGVEIISATPDRIEASVIAGQAYSNTNGVLMGGLLMTFADYLGGHATILNLPIGVRTTTVESKTNFFRPALLGEKVIGVTTPLHRGRRTMVWQTQLMNEDDKLLAAVIQTQMVLDAEC